MKIADLLEGITIDPTTNTLSFNYSDNNGTSTKLGKGKKFPVPYIYKERCLVGWLCGLFCICGIRCDNNRCVNGIETKIKYFY